MKASSESGLWALTISRGATDVIRVDWDFTLVYTSAPNNPRRNGKEVDKRTRGGHPAAPELWISSVNHPDCASRAEPEHSGYRIPTAENFPLLPVQSP